MKNLKVTLAAMMIALFTVIGANNAQAQQQANVKQLAVGLINVQVGAIQADVELDNVLNNFTLVNVENVLNNNDIDILNNVLNNSPILSNNRDILTSLLRDADILTDNQIVVGILTGGQIVFQDL